MLSKNFYLLYSCCNVASVENCVIDKSDWIIAYQISSKDAFCFTTWKYQACSISNSQCAIGSILNHHCVGVVLHRLLNGNRQNIYTITFEDKVRFCRGLCPPISLSFGTLIGTFLIDFKLLITAACDVVQLNGNRVHAGVNTAWETNPRDI
jgi:hypothetical protein